jgi:glycosyltransferase involved in cell wall biosynthesis
MLSAIIATLDSERTLVPTLAMLVPGAMSGLVREAIVSDGGSADGTAAVADVAGCAFMAPPGPLGARLAAAATAARAPWLLFLRAGTVLDATWLDEAARFIVHGDVSAAAFRPAMPAAHSLVGEMAALVRLGLFSRAHPDHGLLIAAALYREVGGHRADAADPEADLLARLGRRRIARLRSGARMVR